MKLDYLDQYLIHFPVSMKAGSNPFQLNPENFAAMDFKAVWTAMEECQSLGLTKSIGVSNFSCKKLADILAFAKIPPAINQVSLNSQIPRRFHPCAQIHGTIMHLRARLSQVKIVTYSLS